MIFTTVIIALALLAALTIFTNKLTVPAAAAGVVIGIAVFLGTSFSGLFMLSGFFIAGTWATRHHKRFKVSIGLEEKNAGRRNINQVFANGGIAALCGIGAFLSPQNSDLLRLMLASSLASATADTLSSELGNVYGKKFYNIISFKPDRRGLDGVVSLEGTLCGIGGALFIGLISTFVFPGIKYPILVVLSGILGNVTDSVFGASLQRQGLLNNDGVNFLNTLISAGFSLCIFFINA